MLGTRAVGALSPAAQAETYKWVDERGVVNYSNTPPPAAAKAAQQIAERVSTVESDPALRRVSADKCTAPSPYEVMQQQEWLQRQRLMHEAELVKATLATPVEEPVVYSYPQYYRPVASGRMHGMHGKKRPPIVSCSSNAGGTVCALGKKRITSKGAASRTPAVPSPCRSSTLSLARASASRRRAPSRRSWLRSIDTTRHASTERTAAGEKQRPK